MDTRATALKAQREQKKIATDVIVHRLENGSMSWEFAQRVAAGIYGKTHADALVLFRAMTHPADCWVCEQITSGARFWWQDVTEAVDR